MDSAGFNFVANQSSELIRTEPEIKIMTKSSEPRLETSSSVSTSTSSESESESDVAAVLNSEESDSNK